MHMGTGGERRGDESADVTPSSGWQTPLFTAVLLARPSSHLVSAPCLSPLTDTIIMTTCSDARKSQLQLMKHLPCFNSFGKAGGIGRSEMSVYRKGDGIVQWNLERISSPGAFLLFLGSPAYMLRL